MGHLKKVIVRYELVDTAESLKQKFDAVCNHKNTVEWIQEKIIDIKKDVPYDLVLDIDANHDLMTIKTRNINVRVSPYEVEHNE